MLTKIRLTTRLKNSRIVKNSFWGMIASGGQMLLLSLFFLILARKYDPSVFATFLIATTIYQFLSAFSTLGLGQWFTRSVVNSNDKPAIINKFLKLQFLSGILFYAVNILVAYSMYDDPLLHHLSIILGINILFDNMIYGLQALNIAEFRQKRNFLILFADAVLKFLASCVLIFYPLPIIILSIILIGIRLVTLNMFLGFGSSKAVSLRNLISYRISWKEVKGIAFSNWAFIIIGSVSMIYWRIGNLIISKTLPLKDVANYEVSYKVLSLSLALPIVVSATVFPSLVELHKSGQKEKFKKYFHNVFMGYLIYSLLVFTFFFSFSQYIIPLAFGENYLDTVGYTREMFFAILVFPTALLQANVLIALHKEKTDMWFNIASLAVNVTICLVGLYFFKSLSVVNMAIFTSFLVFHICQDIFLIRNNISTAMQVIGGYAVILMVAGSYILLSTFVSPFLLFILFWLVAGVVIFIVFTSLVNTTSAVSRAGRIRLLLNKNWL